MKEKLVERLEEMNKLVDQKKAELAQLNANYNVLLGQQAELTALLQVWDELQKPEQKLEAVPTLDDAVASL